MRMNCSRQTFQRPLGLGQYYGLIGLEQTTGFARGYDYDQEKGLCKKGPFCCELENHFVPVNATPLTYRVYPLEMICEALPVKEVM